MRYMKQYSSYIVLVCLLIITNCTQTREQNLVTTDQIKHLVEFESYGMTDFKMVKKIDTHTHINSKENTMINMARENNFKLLNISVGFSDQANVDEQLAVKSKHYRENPEVTLYGTAFSLDGWDNESWSDKVINQLKSDFDKGAVAVKVWKNIGMEFRDNSGNLITLSDPKFDPIFKFIESQNKVLLSHAGEPKNCWLPLDSMTVKNDRDYFREHPEYHMYLHPNMPSYEDLINDRDRMLARYPKLKFVAVHMGSLEWSVEEAGKFLDRFPNASMDLAERISHTQYQSQRNRKKVRDFFIKYQDRILYGTDFAQYEGRKADELEKYMMDTWLNDWRYFNTDDEMIVPQLKEPVLGLKLPKEVVDKIYCQNAEKLFPAFTLY